MSGDGKILISRNGEQLGSFDESDIRAGLVRGTLLPGDHYWREGMAGWKTLRELFPQLCPQGAPPPPRAAAPHAPAPAYQPTQTVVVNNKVVVKNSNSGCGSGCSSGCVAIIVIFFLFAGLGAIVSEPHPPGAAIFLVLALIVAAIVFLASKKRDKED